MAIPSQLGLFANVKIPYEYLDPNNFRLHPKYVNQNPIKMHEKFKDFPRITHTPSKTNNSVPRTVILNRIGDQKSLKINLTNDFQVIIFLNVGLSANNNE